MIFLENYLEKEIIVVDCNAPKNEICKNLGVSANSVFSENNLLRVGEFLLINNKCSKIYVVKLGDTIESISEKFSKPVNEIMKKNNIKTIFIGQQLYI